MKIAILGAKGMLGHDVVTAGRSAGIEVSGHDLPELDITREPCGLEKLQACDWVVNCAGYTDVDGAEVDRKAAFSVNRDGARHVAEWCKDRGVPLLHISTDYVFSGSSSMPYREDDPVKPLNVYGESKLAGEQAVQSVYDRYLIVRTQSLFGINGRNFVKTIVSRLRENDDPIDVVNDQTSCPTYTVHLAGAILRLLNVEKQGIVHVSASGSCTWYEFALAIAEKVKPAAVIRPVTSAKLARPARRPAFSVLDKERYTTWTNHTMSTWQEGLEEYLEEKIRSTKHETQNNIK